MSLQRAFRFLGIVSSIVGLGLAGTNAAAVPLPDSQDSFWNFVDANATIEITLIQGGLRSLGELEFGIYDPADPSLLTPVFSPCLCDVGDTEVVSASFGSPFGFYVRNTGTNLGGPYNHFSDSSLNPDGEDAMVAESLGGNMWSLSFEDFTLPIDPARPDMVVKVSPIAPVPEGSTGSLLALGLLGLVVWRRRVGTVAGSA